MLKNAVTFDDASTSISEDERRYDSESYHQAHIMYKYNRDRVCIDVVPSLEYASNRVELRIVEMVDIS